MKKALFLLLALFIFSYSVNADAKYFYKVDEDNNIIDDAVFVQKTIDGKVIKEIRGGIIEEVEPSISTKKYTPIPLSSNVRRMNVPTGVVYQFVGSFELEDLDKYLSQDQKDFISSFQTVDDYIRVREFTDPEAMTEAFCSGRSAYVELMKKSKGFTAYHYDNIGDSSFDNSEDNQYSVKRLQSNTVDPNNDIVVLELNVFTFIEEVYTPKGYEKETVIAPIHVDIRFQTVDGNLELYRFNASALGNFYKYNENIDYSNYSDFMNKMTPEYVYEDNCGGSDVDDFKFSCLNGFSSSVFEPNVKKMINPDTCAPIIVDKTSTEDMSNRLSINTFVNGKSSLSTSRNTEVTISVVVDNEARRPSYENTVVSKIPKGFEYVEDSSNLGGIYNEENNTITWNLDYLDAESEEILLYKVKVPENADTTLDYKSSASITADGVDEPVKSRVITVNLGSKDKNPKTGDFRELMVLSVLSICGIVLLVILNKNSIKGF